VSVDRPGGRAKIFDQQSKYVDWVDAKQVITRSESIQRDVNRIEIGVRLLTALLQGAQPAPEWVPGRSHPSIPNLVAGASRDEWRPAPGYAWTKSGTAGVVWSPGLSHPTQASRVSSHAEGVWVSDVQYIFETVGKEQREKDAARKVPFPKPPDTTGVLFAPGEFDIYSRNDTLDDLYIFHSKVVPYLDISHLIYHADDNWVVVVLKDGKRLDLGATIQWLVRPAWFFATGITVSRTRDGVTQEQKRFDLLRIDNKHHIVERYLVGIQFVSKPVVGQGGGWRIHSVRDSSPAASAGLKSGDTVISVDDQAIDSIETFRRITTAKGAGNIEIKFIRKGAEQKVLVTPALGLLVVKK
jgi:hypothetical protein